MPRRPNRMSQAEILAELIKILSVIQAADLSETTLRQRVEMIVEARNLLQDYGASFYIDETSARSAIRRYFTEHVNVVIDSAELSVISGIQEHARRIRELRTEEGFVISTKQLGRPELEPDQDVLETLEQADARTRTIREDVAKAVYQRDNSTCVRCFWNYDAADPNDPRYLELHHRIPHESGGDNSVNNLEIRCNICHRQAHTN